MTKLLKTWILISIIALIGIVFSLVIYFVSQFSTVYPPLQQYKFETSANNLETCIIELAKQNTDINYLKKDTVGTSDNGFAYYMEIVIKDDNRRIEYLIKYKDTNDRKLQSELKLIRAIDKLKNIGGYKIEDQEVEELIDIFNEVIIIKIKGTNKKPAHNTLQ